MRGLLIWLALAAIFNSGGMLRADDVAVGEPPADAAGVAFFEQHVRPLLEQRCYKCHSASADEVRGGLHLDSRPGWQTGGDSGPAIVPGQPAESLLLKALSYSDDEDVHMPPDGKLPEAEIALLTDWVKRGAPDPRDQAVKHAKKRVIDLEAERRHWAYQPLAHVEPPPVENRAWARTPVDRFILARLEEKGLTPNAMASRRQLIRRVTFDTIGLPPTPEEVAAFLADSAPDAYERLVDRLLESPHFGERWGRHWLDIARFAESHGFEQDYDRPNAYHYRDFVIKAFNQDLPFDTFVRWQLAGDELAPDNLLAMQATGFLAAGVHATQITANQAEKERYDELDDMTRTVGTTLLGLTIGCARCHDHKYDPIPNKEYYGLVATFTNTVRSDFDLPVDSAADRAALARHEAAGAPLRAALAAFERDEMPGRFVAWLTAGPPDAAADGWIILDPLTYKSQGGATLTKQSDGSLLASGANPEFDVYTLSARTDLKKIKALRIEALADPSLAKSGPGRAENGNFDLTNVRVVARPANGGAESVELKLTHPTATFEQGPHLAVALAIDDQKQSGWAVDPQFGQNHAAVFETAGEPGFEGGTLLEVTLEFNGNGRHNIGRPRLSVTAASPPVTAAVVGLPETLVAALTALSTQSFDSLADSQRAALLEWYKPHDARWTELNDQLQAHLKSAPQPTLIKTLISSEGVPAVRLHTQGPDFYDKTFVLRRGDPNQKVAEASQGFLTVLMRHPDGEKHWLEPPPPGARTSWKRAALARWITDADQGAGQLLARVIVNRLWQHHFGRGIVATPSDFGTQGARPTHPELLDWLAGELIRGGWRLKPLHKLLLTSAVYRQTADVDAARLAADHDNLLWWRRPGQRLEAEIIRDALLATSGQLDPTMFGPGTLDPQMKRRSIYFFVKRSQLVPMMTLFDAPDSLQDLAVRASTTVAPQALLMMNSPIVRGYADGFRSRAQAAVRGSSAAAGATADAGGLIPATVDAAYQIALGRPPTADELAAASDFVERQSAAYRAEGNATADDMALTDLCQTLMSLNEFVFVD